MKKKTFIAAMLPLVALALFLCILYLGRTQLRKEYVAQVIDEARATYRVPAIAICVMDSKQIVYSVFDGVREAETTDKITANDYFHLGSCSKAILSYIAAMMVDEKMVCWDTKLFDVFPELKEASLKAYTDITLEDLLACRAGIQPFTSGSEGYPDLFESQDKAVDFIRYLLQKEPVANKNTSGKFDFTYSNASYSIAASILERISGLSYEELLKKYICQNLGIDVFIGWPYEKSAAQPRGHLLRSDNTLDVIGSNSIYALNPLINPAGNLSMKSIDFAKFVQHILKGMTQSNNRQFRYISTKFDGFSLGTWNGSRMGKSYICLDGTAGTFYARGVMIPESDFGFTVLMNCGSEKAVEQISMKLMKAYYNWWWMFWI